MAPGWNFGGGAGREEYLEVVKRAEPEVPTGEQLSQVIAEANGPSGTRTIEQMGLQGGPDVESSVAKLAQRVVT